MRIARWEHRNDGVDQEEEKVNFQKSSHANTEREIWNIIKIAEQKKLVIFSFISRKQQRASKSTEPMHTVCAKKGKGGEGEREVRRARIIISKLDWIPRMERPLHSPSCSELHGSAIMFVSYVTCPRQSNRLFLLVNHAHSLARYAIPDLLHHLISGAPPHRPTDETRSDTLIKMKWIFNYKKCNSVELGSRLFKLRRASEQFFFAFFPPNSLDCSSFCWRRRTWSGSRAQEKRRRESWINMRDWLDVLQFI